YHLIDRGARYVGLIGSKRKIKLIFDDLEAEGISPESLSGVYAPLGIDIGSQTVPEIAVSILAELIAHRNLGRVPGREQPFTVA
ncbi:MAG: XdhC family protein, partial [Pirellulales bacterium]